MNQRFGENNQMIINKSEGELMNKETKSLLINFIIKF